VIGYCFLKKMGDQLVALDAGARSLVFGYFGERGKK
jgi:hypothetical protein